MYRLNVIFHISKRIIQNSNAVFSQLIQSTRYTHKNLLMKSLQVNTIAKYFHNNHESQEKKFRKFLAAPLHIMFLHYLLGIEDIDEEVPEVILIIKRSILLIQKGQFDKAEQMLHLALRQAQTIQHYDAITYIHDAMANLAFDIGDYHKAQTLFISVLQRLIVNGVSENDMKVIHISLKLAKVFEYLKEIIKAEQGYKFCMENLKQRVEKHPEDKDTILLQGMTFDWYAQMLMSQSRHTEAFYYFLQAYNICKEINGEEYEQTVVLLNDLGTVCYKQEKYDEAIKYLSAAARIGNNLPNMVDLGWIHINLGNVFLKKGLYNEAKKSCLKGKKIAKARDDNNSLLKANECLEEIKMLLL